MAFILKKARAVSFGSHLPLEVGEKIETKATVIEACIRAKVLLIEDNPVNCIVAEGFLNNLGHDVVIATTGQEARAIFSEQEFDIALVDINLPDCDGVELIQQLKDDALQHEHEENVTRKVPPMIAVSAHVFNEEVESYLSSGFDGFLPKPLEKEALSQLIVAQLDGKTLLLPQPDPNDAVCKQNGNRVINNSDECSTQMVDVLAKYTTTTDSQHEGDTPVKLIDSKVIEGDLSILGLDKMKQIVVLFEESSNLTLNELVEASEADNGREVKSLAHKLKGSAGSLGLLALYNLCQSIEASEEPLLQYRDNVHALSELVKDSLEALLTYVSA